MLCLLVNNIKIFCVIIIIFFAFTACREVETHIDPLQAAIENGIIMEAVEIIKTEEEEILTETWFDIIYPEYETLNMTLPVTARIQAPQVERLTFRGTRGYVEIFTMQRAQVSEGDLLATLSSEDLMLHIELTQAENRLEQFEAANQSQEENLLANIREARTNNIDEESAIRLEIAEIDYQIFLVNRDNTINDLRTYINDLRLRINGENMYAPFDGQIIRTIENDTFIERRTQIVTLANMSNFVLNINANDFGMSFWNAMNDIQSWQSTFRFGDILSFESESRHPDDPEKPLLEFDAMLVTDMYSGTAFFDWGIGFTIYPVDKEALLAKIEELDISAFQFNNMRFTTMITMRRLHQSLTLPRRAVSELGERYFVTVHNNGVLSRRFVEIGSTGFQGIYEILSGIDIDTEVVILR